MCLPGLEPGNLGLICRDATTDPSSWRWELMFKCNIYMLQIENRALGAVHLLRDMKGGWGSKPIYYSIMWGGVNPILLCTVDTNTFVPCLLGIEKQLFCAGKVLALCK